MEKNAGGGTFAALYCTIFHTPSFHKSSGTPITSLDRETAQLLAFSTLFTMFTEVCSPLEKLNLALVPHTRTPEADPGFCEGGFERGFVDSLKGTFEQK